MSLFIRILFEQPALLRFSSSVMLGKLASDCAMITKCLNINGYHIYYIIQIIYDVMIHASLTGYSRVSEVAP
jgi:hypothetical protein